MFFLSELFGSGKLNPFYTQIVMTTMIPVKSIHYIMCFLMKVIEFYFLGLDTVIISGDINQYKNVTLFGAACATSN